MATLKPRITITLEPEHYAVLRRVAKVQGGSMSRIVTDMVSELAPMLNSVAVALEAAAQAQLGMKVSIREAAKQAEDDMRPLLQIVRSQFDYFATEMGRIVSASQGVVHEPSQALPSDGAAGGGQRVGGEGVDCPRSVITGATNSDGRGSDGLAECICTITVHERMEHRACPVHGFRGGQ